MYRLPKRAMPDSPAADEAGHEAGRRASGDGRRRPRRAPEARRGSLRSRVP